MSLVYSGLNGESVDTFRSRFETAISSGELNITSRFQQVNAGAGSDKLLGGTIDGGTSTPEAEQVPEPTGLLGLGLFAGGTIMLNRRKRAQTLALTLPMSPTC